MNNLLLEGVNLMFLGMGAVFVFLILLVFATGIMSSLVSRYLPEPTITPVPNPPNPSIQPAGLAQNHQLMAVIAAAIHRHRKRHK